MEGSVMEVEGILPLWKERGMTSHDCVFKLRKLLNTKKIGHTGTLDPEVDGVLPICIGRATKVVEYMMETGKGYIGEITVGFSTTTEDSSGEIVERKAVENIPSASEIDNAMASFEGEITQVPPMYSAVKVNGKRLYQYARSGEQVERPRRVAKISRFLRTSEVKVDSSSKTLSWRFEVYCGKGTYVRTLAVDLGRKLGYPAHMSDLSRTLSGAFKMADCLTLDQIADRIEHRTLDQAIFPLEFGLQNLPKADIDTALWHKVLNGAVLPSDFFGDGAAFPIVLFYQEKAWSIYDVHPTKKHLLKPVKSLRIKQ